MTEPSRRRSGGLVRSYVITGGRARAGTPLDVVTLLLATQNTRPLHHLTVEQRGIVDICRGGALLSLAEVASHLGLPVSVTRVLVVDLIDAGLIATRTAPVVQNAGPELLKEVLDALRARL
ncbi:DUF742 domain-containing protein [Streptomyces triticagri]|uniref:DUF742 domain-containing protein n=1 Tax=Streptomyces triticagri TaxID=2293568 RepID=A0A372LYJ5_9ACTN|nr:DUF742 domain-containing protein [Streptomyces triticagri]RFU83756.1 DUF742 domain-containing protein [Streptomyces triticagri]